MICRLGAPCDPCNPESGFDLGKHGSQGFPGTVDSPRYRAQNRAWLFPTAPPCPLIEAV